MNSGLNFVCVCVIFGVVSFSLWCSLLLLTLFTAVVFHGLPAVQTLPLHCHSQYSGSVSRLFFSSVPILTSFSDTPVVVLAVTALFRSHYKFLWWWWWLIVCLFVCLFVCCSDVTREDFKVSTCMLAISETCVYTVSHENLPLLLPPAVLVHSAHQTFATRVCAAI